MKKIMQFRYHGPNHPDNYPLFNSYKDMLTVGNIFKDYGPVSHLGIQAPPGVKFYLNGSSSSIMVGDTGIYELELENVGRINSIRFDKNDLVTFYEERQVSDLLIIDMIYEGV